MQKQMMLLIILVLIIAAGGWAYDTYYGGTLFGPKLASDTSIDTSCVPVFFPNSHEGRALERVTFLLNEGEIPGDEYCRGKINPDNFNHLKTEAETKALNKCIAEPLEQYECTQGCHKYNELTDCQITSSTSEVRSGGDVTSRECEDMQEWPPTIECAACVIEFNAKASKGGSYGCKKGLIIR